MDVAVAVIAQLIKKRWSDRRARTGCPCNVPLASQCRTALFTRLCACPCHDDAPAPGDAPKPKKRP